MRKNNYSTPATFTTVNGTEICYQGLFQGAEKQIDYAVRSGKLSYEDGQDAMQDAALKIIKSSGSYDESKSKSGSKYGYRVAENCCKNRWADRNMKPVDSFSQHERIDDEGDSWTDPEIYAFRSKEFFPERDLESRENVDFIWTTVNALEETDRTVAKMLIMRAKPEAIAEALGCSADAASVRVHRVRKTLEPVFHNLLDEFGISRKKPARHSRCQAA